MRAIVLCVRSDYERITEIVVRFNHIILWTTVYYPCFRGISRDILQDILLSTVRNTILVRIVCSKFSKVRKLGTGAQCLV